METTDRRLSRIPGEDRSATLAIAREVEEPVATLQWGIGFFCLVLGVLMLVAAQQFGGASWSPLHEHVVLVSIIGLFAGTATAIDASPLGVGAVALLAEPLDRYVTAP